jgi:hypothetical protein
MMENQDVRSIIFDTGTGTCKCGFAWDDAQ